MEAAAKRAFEAFTAERSGWTAADAEFAWRACYDEAWRAFDWDTAREVTEAVSAVLVAGAAVTAVAIEAAKRAADAVVEKRP